MKKVIFFVSSLGDGGAQRVISILSAQMARKGMATEIVTYIDEPVLYEIHPEVKVTCVQKCTGKENLVVNLLWLRRYFKENAEVILSFLAPFNMLAIVSVMGTRIPMIVADRNDPAKVPKHPVIRFSRDVLYGFANHIIVQTENNKRYFKHYQKKTEIIYNPVDLQSYTGSALQCEKRKCIVSAGRLVPQKNQKMLLKAFAGVLKHFPEYQLIIYGEGGFREELEKYAANLGIDGKVMLAGSVTDLYEKMKSAEIFVLSSDYEGMPNALIEAMCLGLPVVSTKVSGATDLVQNGENGLLVDINASEQLEEALETLLSDKELRNRMAKEAQKVSERLQPEKILEQWLKIIRRYYL